LRTYGWKLRGIPIAGAFDLPQPGERMRLTGPGRRAALWAQAA